MTPDPQNRIQAILGAFTGLLSGYSQCRCRDKIKNMDFRVSLGYGGRVAAETFIFSVFKVPSRVRPEICSSYKDSVCVRDVLGIYYYLFTCTMYYVLLSICHLRVRGCVRIFFIFTMDTAWASVRRLVRVYIIF